MQDSRMKSVGDFTSRLAKTTIWNALFDKMC